MMGIVIRVRLRLLEKLSMKRMGCDKRKSLQRLREIFLYPNKPKPLKIKNLQLEFFYFVKIIVIGSASKCHKPVNARQNSIVFPSIFKRLSSIQYLFFAGIDLHVALR